MALFVGEVRPDEGGDDLSRQGRANDPRAETEHVHVVVLDALMGGVSVVAESGPNTMDLVRRDRRANAAPAEKDAAIHRAVEDRRGNFSRVVRIVNRVKAKRAQV